MFSERFHALMNISEVSNSLLGRNVNMNPSHIGRLRSGARPLAKKHEYLSAMCRYLTGHLKKDYQLDALRQLTGIDSTSLSTPESTALYLEQWLLEQDEDTSAAAGRLISGFSRTVRPASASSASAASNSPAKYASYLYGNAGKRTAVEQFFTMILQEEKTQTLLLFSDENMAWLYEDPAFSARWTELFTKVIMKGNRVKIIHTVSRDMNEMLEAITKWIPIYMTGMIEPYCYPRLRDGVFRRTLFLAPNTAAVVSSSVQEDTGGMLNFFVTDRAALNALAAEYERYFSLCRPLMRIYTEKDSQSFQAAFSRLANGEGEAFFCCAIPPVFTMPEKLSGQLLKQNGSDLLPILHDFNTIIRKQRLTLILLDPKYALRAAEKLRPSMSAFFPLCDFTYTKEQYAMHIESLLELEKNAGNLKVCFVRKLPDDTLLYVKEDVGVILAKENEPKIAFMINETSMTGAFRDYAERHILKAKAKGLV